MAFLSRLLKRTPQRVTKARRYLPRTLGTEAFFRVLRERNVSYVVLRWFETLPDLAPGEDLDLLVADEDFEVLTSYLQGDKQSDIPCDVYTASGLPGSDYLGIPYFPRSRSQEVLQRAQWQGDLVKVPGPRDHFLTLAFHAVYHKGFKSGLSSTLIEGGGTPPQDHDYPAHLQELGSRVNLAPPTWTLDGLDQLLAAEGWRPQPDSLEKWARKNVWLRSRLEADRPPLGPEWAGFTVFVVRERGVPFLEAIKEDLDSEGFLELGTFPLSGEALIQASEHIRGGNWGRGPFPSSGGKPAVMIAAVDLYPILPDARLSELHPGLTNARIERAKNMVRRIVNSQFPANQICNVLHSSDNPWQALEYAGIGMPAEVERLGDRCRSLTEEFQTPHRVLRAVGGHGKRSKVELVDFQGQLAICKTFRPGKEAFLAQEVLARSLPSVGEISVPILERGPRHIVLELVDPLPREAWGRVTGPDGPFLDPHNFKVIQKFLLDLRKQGYEHIDFQPSQWMWGRGGGLRHVDSEFLVYTGQPRTDLKGCYAWYPVPSSYQGPRPRGQNVLTRPYDDTWKDFLGFPRWMAVRDLPEGAYLLVQRLYGLWLWLARRFRAVGQLAVRSKKRLGQLARQWGFRR